MTLAPDRTSDANADGGHRSSLNLKVDPRDVLALRDALEDDERLLVDTVRAFCDDRIAPHIGTWWDEGIFPRELATEFGDLGLLGMHLDGYGCSGSTATAYGLACLELEACDSGVRSFVSVQGSLAMFPIWAFGSEEHKQRWLPEMAAGTAIGCFGLTEPDSGSDPSSMRTFAQRTPSGDWILNGTKMWITNGSIADVAVVWAMTSDGVRGFVVPTDTPGFSAPQIHRKVSLRASVTSEMVMDEVKLPKDAMLPGVEGMKGPLSCLNEARFGILFGACGAARSCYEAALDYALDREQFGTPIAAMQLTQRKLVELMIAVQRGTLMALHIGRLKDAGRLATPHISMGKMDNVRMALDVAREARSVLGANGITLEYPVIRHMNNLESVFTYEGTNEIHTLILGQAITGLAAFR